MSPPFSRHERIDPGPNSHENPAHYHTLEEEKEEEDIRW